MSTPTPVYNGKLRTPLMAVRAYCRWCNGGNPITCVSPLCRPLFSFRLPKKTNGRRRNPLRAIHARCLECSSGVGGPRECWAFEDFSESQPACALWPHRLGKRLVSENYREHRREQAKKQRQNPGAEACFAPKKATKGHGLGVGSPEHISNDSGAVFNILFGGGA